jgi:hypothetical protein
MALRSCAQRLLARAFEPLQAQGGNAARALSTASANGVPVEVRFVVCVCCSCAVWLVTINVGT